MLCMTASRPTQVTQSEGDTQRAERKVAGHDGERRRSREKEEEEGEEQEKEGEREETESTEGLEGETEK